MNRHKPWLGQPQETPLTYILLLVYAVCTYPGRRAGSDATLAQWAREEFLAAGVLVQGGEPWRLATYSLVHGGLVHVLLNASSLIALGPPLERWLGTARFALLYGVSAVAGGIAGVYWHGPWSPLVGGSGALFGMMGAVLALNMRAGRHVFDFLEHAGARSFLALLLANLIFGAVLPHVSNAAHLGGLLAGFVLVFCFLAPGQEADRVTRWIRAGWITLLCSTVLYQCWPTARADYLMRRLSSAADDHEMQRYLEALRALPYEERLPGTAEGELRGR